MCVLRIYGDNLDVDALLAAAPLEVCARFERGKRQFGSRGPVAEQSGIHVAVSDADFSDLASQVADAIAFLRKHEAALRAARSFPGVELMGLDFGVEQRDVAVQSEHFPPALLELLGTLGIELVISIYPAAAEEQ